MGRRAFSDRRAAGRALGERLAREQLCDPLVLGLARGGVVVAAEVATMLGAPLDVLVVRKLGLPGQPELAMGAIAAVGTTIETVTVDAVLLGAGADRATFEEVSGRELIELRRRETAYRGRRRPLTVAGRDVVLVDDGLATGASMHVAVLAVRGGAPLAITAAVPVGSARAISSLEPLVARLVCLQTPRPFRAVGQVYGDFGQVTDGDVRGALRRAARVG